MRLALLTPAALALLATALSLLHAAAARAAENPASAIPEAWLARWRAPAAGDRPLQIVHGIDPRGFLRDGVGQMVSAAADDKVMLADMQACKDLGLGGIVCNVAFKDYMKSEANFKVLADGVEACAKLGLVVWLYDEQGYPSGGAGGLVLAKDPAVEAVELAYDAGAKEPFIVRPAYEFTHASNNYHAARRYVNLLDDRATKLFIAQTHEVYWKRLQPYFGKTIQATFTDEPSLIAVNLGQIPESARKKVPVVDPIDPKAKALPAVPWGYDLADQYRKRYGEDLLAARQSLFTGDAEADRKVRRQFYALVADLVADRYFGAIQQWCHAHQVASSGHTLWEEALIHHPTLEGSALKVLSRMDIPGLDMLTSNPEAALWDGWVTVALPASAAILTGGRRVMTEISDFGEKMGGQGPAGLPEMQAAAAWQAAWGVTDFTLYYSPADRPAEKTRAYGDTVGRLNAILKPAALAPEALLYYPAYDLWPEYRPTAEPLKIESQSPRAQKIVGSFRRLGGTLARCQVPFALIDPEFLAAARVAADGTLTIKDHAFRAVLLPDGVEPPASAAKVLDAFRAKGGLVLRDGPDAARLAPPALWDTLKAAHRLQPASDHVILGRFVREGRLVLVAVNVGRAAYAGRITVAAATTWQAMDPATGAVAAAPADGDAVQLKLAPRQAVILVGLPR